MEEIIRMQRLLSGATAIASKTTEGIALELGTGVLFLEEGDLYDFVKFIVEVEAIILGKDETG